MEKKQWFKLEDIKLDIDKNEFNDFEKLRKELTKARKITNDSWYLSHIKINAKLTFMGKLNTPNGEVETEFAYYIKTNYKDMKDEAKITIYEQTFTGLNEAVTIRFSSGSIISKIVFGDIEKCYQLLKDEVDKQLKEYNNQVEIFNKEIEELQEKDDKKREDED